MFLENQSILRENLYKAKWGILVSAIVVCVAIYVMFYKSYKTVVGKCIVVSTNVAPSQYGPKPYANCKLESGKIIVVSPSKVVSFEVADKLFYQKPGTQLEVYLEK